jgi:hypothetical protein
VSRKKAVLLDKKKRRSICKKAFYEIFYELFEAVKSEYFNMVALSNVLRIRRTVRVGRRIFARSNAGSSDGEW